MMDPTQINQFAQTNQIDPATILKEFIQIRFLHELYQEPDATNLIFKGGTAIRLLLAGTRFSEDLDFTVMNVDGSAIPKLIKKVTTKLNRQDIPLTVKDMNSLAGVSLKLFHQTSLMPMPLTIKLDFSFREAVLDPVWGTVTTSLPVTTFTNIHYMSASEILVEKIRALINRTKARDLYDLWYLLSRNIPFEKSWLEQKLTAYGKKWLPQELSTKIEAWEVEQLENELRRFLPRHQRSIVANLKEQSLQKLKQLT